MPRKKLRFWSYLILFLAVTGILLILYDRFFGASIFLSIGVILFSAAGIMVGIEAIINRKVILPSPYHKRLSETYIGISAIAQGILIILTGCFLIALMIIDYVNEGRNLFHHFVKRPGIPLLFLSLICLLTAVSLSIGSVEEKQGSKFVVILNLITSRFLGSTILLLIGIIILGLGILEISDPQYFDSLGGGFLELLFLGQKK